MNTISTQRELLYFHDDGHIPNSSYPVVIYHNAFTEHGDVAANWLERLFELNNWSNSWRSGILTYHHYHSTAHEVLGIYEGATELQLGGEHGETISVKAGDIVIIPAGVGHRNMHEENDVQVLGAYDRGRHYDIQKGLVNERPASIENINSVPPPETDPLFGMMYGMCKLWKE